MIFWAVCRLTFYWRWCIMKIRPAACASGPSKRALCILTKKEGRCPSQFQHISKNPNRFSSLSGNVTRYPPSSVKCSVSISHPMRLITSIAAAGCRRSEIQTIQLQFFSLFFLSAFPLSQERKGLQADLPLWGRLTRLNATRPAPFCYHQSELREHLQRGGYSQPQFYHRR